MIKEKHWKVLKMKTLVKEGNIKKFEKEHTEMFNALRDSDQEFARINMREHLQYIKKGNV